jgi:hypothetical protein
MIPTIDSEDFIKIKQLLTGIGVISKLTMIEQSSKAGDKTRKAVRSAFLSSNTQWTQDYKNGRRILRKNTSGSLNQSLGIRVAHRNGGGIDDPANMANMIVSFTHKTTGTTVVGGTSPAHSPVKIENGKVTGRLKRQKGISKQTIAILEKLNYGNRAGKYSKQGFLKWRTKDGGQSSDSMKYITGWSDGKPIYDGNMEDHWKPRHFFEEGWNNVSGQVISDMTTELARLIGERANNTDLSKVREYAI